MNTNEKFSLFMAASNMLSWEEKEKIINNLFEAAKLIYGEPKAHALVFEFRRALNQPPPFPGEKKHE